MKKVLSLLGLVSLSFVFASSAALADAPLVKKSAPGFYRVMLGDFEVTALSDGTVPLPVDKILTNTEPAKTQKALAKHHLSTPVTTSVNAYLINTGSKLVMIDAGAGRMFGPTLGRLLTNLNAAGYAPEQIDEIYITHMHGDHAGGLLSGDLAAFPNAVVRADQHDADHWLSEAAMNKTAPDNRGSYKNAMKAFAPYLASGKFKPFEGDTELVPGVKAIAAHGHTPGHSIYLVESQGKKLILWGDLMHVAAVQFENPSVTITYDTDSKAAMAERKKAYADAVKNDIMVGATHLSFPGLGHLRSEGKGYVWIPLNYQTVQ